MHALHLLFDFFHPGFLVLPTNPLEMGEDLPQKIDSKGWCFGEGI